MGWGIGLGAAVQSGLNVYKTFKDVESQGLRDKLTEQQIQKNQIDLETEQGRKQAEAQVQSVMERYLGGGVQSAPSPDGGPQGPGDAPNVQRPMDFSVLSDPVKYAQMERDLAPHMMKILGPKEGIAFMKANRDAVENFVPQAGILLANGDVEGAKKMLRASGGRYKDVVDITPVESTVEGAEGPTQTPRSLWKLDFGAKGATVIDANALVEFTTNPLKMLELTKAKKAEARADKTLEIAATDSQNRGLTTRATLQKTEAEIANMPKELKIKEDEAANRAAVLARQEKLDAERVKNDARRLDIEDRRAKTEAVRARIADDNNKETRELRKSIDAAKSAADAEKLINSELDKLGGVDELTGKAQPSPLRVYAPEIVLKAQEMAKGGATTVGEAARGLLTMTLKNADAIGSQLADAAAKDDKGASLAFEVADALKQGVPVRDIRAFAGHMGVSESKIGKAIAAAKEATKKGKDAPAKGLGIGARPAPASSAVAPLPPELESARQLSDRMAAEEAARRRVKHEVPAGQGLGGYVPVDELTAQPQRAGLGLGR